VRALMIGMLLLSCSLHAAVEGIGIGGGGAMSGISFDPYKSGHMYIGTDMGLVYESFDLGDHWMPISQEQISFYGDLKHPSHMGFRPNGWLYWASGGCHAQMSMDRGVTWVEMKSLNDLLPKQCLNDSMRIKSWFFSADNPKWIGVGTTNGLFLSQDEGKTWQRLFQDQDIFVALFHDKETMYNATSAGLFKLDLLTSHVEPLLTEPLSNAAMGEDKAGITFIGIEKTEHNQKKVFIKKTDKDEWTKQILPIGRFVLMSPTNSSIIYFVGNETDQKGEVIWLSEDAGTHWRQIYVSDKAAYRQKKINPNPVGINVGFWDSEYQDVQVSPITPSIIGCSGNFFFKRSLNKGATWKYPYTMPVDASEPITREAFWKATQLNPISVFVVKRHPNRPNVIVAGLADIGCVLSQDNGQSWRMCNIPSMNSIYDFEFSPTHPDRLYAAASSIHDFPQDWHGDIQNTPPGGVFVSEDLGSTWSLLSPNTSEFNNPYLSLAIDHQQTPCHIYAGTQGKGIVASYDCGVNWQRLNQGFEPQESSVNSSEQKGSLIFPRIKISPNTGDVYALHAGNRLWADEKNPYLNFTGLYRLNKTTKAWQLLGRPPQVKAPGAGGLYWKYPIDFAVDWDNPQYLYLVDMATAGTWKIGGLWYSGDGGTAWQQVKQFDVGHRIILKGHARYLVGWSEPGEPFIYAAGEDNLFKPVNIRIPLQRVNDVLIDNDGYLFGTFGGGIFKY
jgi:photosystem II stability/assembly factor-like uncharacterized protein